MKSKGHFFDDIDRERFKEFSIDVDEKIPIKKSILEAQSILQAEKENLVINPRRPNLELREPNLDFVIDRKDDSTIESELQYFKRLHQISISYT